MIDDAPRAYTPEEIRKTVLEHVAHMAHYWGTLEVSDNPKTPLERCNGLAFSILAMIDGTSAGVPAINLSMSPHESDKAYCIENGENYYEPDMVFNDCSLHDMWKKYRKD